MDRKLRMGMVGGGKGAFIGGVHRIAAAIDGKIELVCGAFSSTAEKSRESGRELFLPDSRVYGSYKEMMAAEAALPAEQRMDFVSIVTPNHMHFPVAMEALKHGFHVVCDKPMTTTLDESRRLAAAVKESGLLFCLTHNYTGYPMVKEARELVRSGALGEIRKVVAEYPQGWLAVRMEEQNKQASWRTDPSKAGASCCIGDLGVHAANLAEFITGVKVKSLCADLTTFLPGRELEDDGNVLLRFENGAKGVLYASQISVGEENSLHIRVYGSKGGLEWDQMEPNTLKVMWLDKPSELRRTGLGYLSDCAKFNTRIPAGHPEAYLEAFANVYRNFAATLSARIDGRKASDFEKDFPGVCEGVRGLAFIETCVASSKSSSKWLDLP